MFSDILRDLRKQKGMTQQDIANLVGVTYQAVGKWERGASTPDYEVLIKLANYFNVPTDTLLGRFSKNLLGDKPLFNSHDTDDETVEIENQMKYDPDYRTLYNAKKKLPPETIAAYMVILKRLMGETN